MPLILLIIGVVLIVYNYRAIKREQKGKQDDSGFENISFQSVLQDSKEEFNDYKMEIGLLRKDMAESLTELQEEIFDIKKDLHRLKDIKYNLLKNNNDEVLKNNSGMYENKEGLENNYLIDEKEMDISINEPHTMLQEKKDNEVENNINNETNDSAIFDSEIDDGIISEINFSVKVDSNKTATIKKLLGEGLTEEQICRELSVSKGEVLLVKGLFKK